MPPLGLLVVLLLAAASRQEQSCYSHTFTLDGTVSSIDESQWTKETGDSCTVKATPMDSNCSGGVKMELTGAAMEIPSATCTFEGETVLCRCMEHFSQPCNSLHRLLAFTAVGDNLQKAACVRERLFSLLWPNQTDYETLVYMKPGRASKTMPSKPWLDTNETTAGIARNGTSPLRHLFSSKEMADRLSGHRHLATGVYVLVAVIVVYSCVLTYSLVKDMLPRELTCRRTEDKTALEQSALSMDSTVVKGESSLPGNEKAVQ